MLRKIETSKQANQNEQFKAKERLETALHKLQTLKNQISELRLKCEDLKKLLSENKSSELQCSKCGDTKEKTQESWTRDSIL